MSNLFLLNNHISRLFFFFVLFCSGIWPLCIILFLKPTSLCRLLLLSEIPNCSINYNLPKILNVLHTVGMTLFPSFLKGRIAPSFTALTVVRQQQYLLEVFTCAALARVRAPRQQDPDPVFISRGEVKKADPFFVIRTQ